MINLITNNIGEYSYNSNPAKEIFTKYVHALIQEQGTIEGLDLVLLADYINGFFDEKKKAHELFERYEGKNVKIFEKRVLDERLVKANNKIHIPLRAMITEQKLGYMFGVESKKESADEKANDFLKDFFQETEMGVVETETAKYASITGKAYILLFLDKRLGTDTPFPYLSKIKPWEADVLEYEDEAILGVRVYNTFNLEKKQEEVKVNLYDSTYIYTFTLQGVQIHESESPVKHGFQMVPLISFKNNSNETGDWEKAEGLMDAYDSVVSRRQDAIEELADSLFVIEGLSNGKVVELSDKDRKLIRENGILVVPGGGTGSYKSKTLDIAATEAQLKTIRENIFRTCQAVDLLDPTFGGNESGVARQFKFQELENKSKNTETAFKLAYKRLLKTLDTFTSIYMQTPIDWKQVTISFTRNTANLPTDVPELMRVLTEAVRGEFISKETARKHIPFIDNAEAEVERIKEESMSEEGFMGLSAD